MLGTALNPAGILCNGKEFYGIMLIVFKDPYIIMYKMFISIHNIYKAFSI